jgi:hypothetical protein
MHQYTGFAAAGARQHQHAGRRSGNGTALLVIKGI